ncbi:MAG TPA: FAD-dependent oxidoreductase [Candidatus Dormibacteraeota bacterium]|jgi:NAD(P)H-nitrite reductase large subunit|nr:FAD-dependent oxidoreductase [Candidatus Dormibacteraeota bacterium]
MGRRYVVVGNGIAGTTCAETLRAEEPDCAVTLVGLEPYPLYNRVSLPRYLKRGIPRERVILRTVEEHAARGIDLRLERSATALDTEGRTVHLDDGGELPYDALLVCTGGHPLPYSAPGADGVRDQTFAFQTLDETEALLEKISASRTAAVVGGSFIAYELAEGFRHDGLDVYWIQRGPRFLRRVLDEEGGQMVDFLAQEAGVTTIYNEEVSQVTGVDGHVAIHTSAGRDLSVDMLGYGLGLRMYTEWLQNTPIKIDGGVVVDEYLETDAKGVFAAGDIAKFVDLMLDGQYNQMGTWDNAEEHGRTAALNMIGRRQPYREVPTYTTSMFKSNLAVMGITPENTSELESVTRLDLPGRSYRALFFYRGRIAGGVLIGTPKGRKKLIEMMQAGLAVAPADREKLLDPANLV